MNGEANAGDPLPARVELDAASPDAVAGPMRATVLVRPKDGILDPQGQAVRDSLRKLGFAVGNVRVGRLIEVELEATNADEANAQLDGMCRQLLTNPLIETYEIRLAGAAQSTEGPAAAPTSTDAAG